ncbi:MAG: YceI family protein [Thermoplasmataceae archaeon]
MAENKWIMDRQHSSLEFSVRHMMISHVSGKFNEFNIDASEDTENVENSTVNVIINAASIDTGNTDRDNHLKSPDFLNAQQFPHIIFKSEKIKGSGEEFHISGNLTIRETTKPFQFQIERTGPIKDPYGKMRQGISMTGTINRKDFGLVWNMVLEGGGLLVGDGIKITVNLELVLQD